jgi:transposase
LVQNGYPEVAWLDSIPGIGPVFSSGIAAEIGDLQRFSQVLIWDKKHKCDRLRNSQELTDAVAKYAGLWWQRNASGQFVGEDLSLNRQGNSYLRYFILEAADCMRRYIPSFAAYYQKKHEQSLRHKHKRALVLTGCKALELFVALLRQQEPYRAREVKPTLH